jgi:magnesium-protoporphyrin O-methyltransferase
MVDALGDSLAGARVLEVGGGSGVAQVEMLRRGAESTVCVDLSDETVATAAELFAEAGFEGRYHRISGDFVEVGGEIAPADVVYLNRVVCCYPDMPALVDAATGHTEGRIAISYPRRSWWVRLSFGLTNLLLRLQRIDFRVFVHDPRAIASRMSEAGLTRVSGARTMMWHWSVWERPALT